MPSLIRKRSDPHVLRLRRVRDGDVPGFLFCEGSKIVGEFFDSPWAVTSLFHTAETRAEAKSLLSFSRRKDVATFELTDDVMKFCSDLNAPPGLIAVGPRPPRRAHPIDTKQNPLLLVIHGLQLPQNVGALMRTAEATGVAEIWATDKTADAYGPKSVRGSSGSVFRVPVRTNVPFAAAMNELKSQGVTVVGSSQNGAVDYTNFDWKKPTALVMGAEGPGLSADDTKQFDKLVRIPMKGKVESLNVGVAAAVCLFEAARQRSL